MSEQHPSLVIGLPVYNGEEGIAQALRSILEQDYPALSVLVSDNASTDRTIEVVESVARGDSRVTVRRRSTTCGAAEHFNEVFQAAPPSTYFAWAAHDDARHPTFARRCVEMLEATPDAVLCGSTIRFVNGAGQLVSFAENICTSRSSLAERLYELYRRFGWFGIYGVMRRDAMSKTQLYRPIYGGDVVFMADLMRHGEFLSIPDPLFDYRAPDREKRPEEYLKAIDPSKTIVARPFTQLAVDILACARENGRSRSEAAEIEAMIVRTLGSENALWRARILGEAGMPDFGGLEAQRWIERLVVYGWEPANALPGRP